MGTGIGHLVPLVAYLGFWVMCILSLTGRPLQGLYYLMPFIPYRTLRDHFLDYPLGGNVFTILVLCVILGALIHKKGLPRTPLYTTWLIYAIYLYISLWVGVALSSAPAPLWLSDINFVTWKDYMVMPLLFVAAGLVVEDRKAVRMIVILAGISLLFIDRSALLESLSRNMANFDESKRDSGPLGYGSNQTAAYLAQFALFIWGVGQYLKVKQKFLAYTLVAITFGATMYTFSRAAYLALVAGIFLLGLLKDRKLLVVGCVFLLTWQLVVPASVSQRVNMTHNENGQLEASAQERVSLWEDAKNYVISSPIVGSGYATYQLTPHVDGLRDTHNWYIKVMVETGAIGLIIVLFMLQQMISLSFRLFRKATDPLYKGLGLGLVLAMCSTVITNMFGDRWTYLEINGLLWVLFGAAARAFQLMDGQQQPAPVLVSSKRPPHLQARFQ